MFWRPLTLLVLLLAQPIGVQASHCATDGDALELGVLYVLDNPYVYLENNGQAGLQRGSANSIVADAMGWPSDTGMCAHPDLILF